MKIYIAGPMTGLPDDNYPAFLWAEAELAELGHEVVNPAKLNRPGEPWAKCMRVDIPAMLACDALFVLPGWMGSRGAHLEVSIARDLAMPIFFAPHCPPPAEVEVSA